MNTEKLYIGSLRIVVNRKIIDDYYAEIKHNHLKFVLLRNSDITKYRFVDVKTRQKYKNLLNGKNYIGIDCDFLYSFNEVTGNTKKHLSKRKVLSLFNEKRKEWRSKNEKNI